MFSNPLISIAGQDDVNEIVRLLNSAYRGESSKKGWTTEADLIEGEIRTSDGQVSELMNTAGHVFIIYRKDHQIIGNVNLQLHGDRLYLGLFAVSPVLQGGGIGREILKACEEYAHHIGIKTIYMRVVSLRAELIAWYKRNGYMETGEVIPFPDDGKSGKHKMKLEFIVLEKKLTV